jgi:hypothetical protein
MCDTSPNWRCFISLPSDSEAATVSKHCNFSLATLEIACDPAAECFALVEQEQVGLWRWAVLTISGVLLREGQQPTPTDAKRIAAEALILVHA